MNIPADLLYTKSHEWVRETDGIVEVGLTDYAQEALGDLVFVNLPVPGDPVEMGKPFADVESVKAVSDVYSPVSGIVSQINEELLEHPDYINQSAYGAWLIRVADITERTALLDASEYETITGED